MLCSSLTSASVSSTCLRSGSVHLTLHSMRASSQAMHAGICREFTTSNKSGLA